MMRLGILVTGIGNFGKKGFYNIQEVGLAKALAASFDEIIIYKLVPIDQKESIEVIEGCKSTFIHFIPAKRIGINGIFDINILDATLNVIIYFSDTQFAVPTVYRWARKNGIYFYPYIGVIESHSVNVIKRFLVNCFFRRNIRVYRKCCCLVKTPAIENELKSLGVKKIVLTPVGLDVSILHNDYITSNSIELKIKYGYQPEDKVLLFIGRLSAEKQPDKMLEIFSNLVKRDAKYKLLIVGSGELKDHLKNMVLDYGLSDKVQFIQDVLNKDIWELYRFADSFINLNQQEIFGMTILEAMYYECKVIAWKAPGPDFIIENKVSGYLVDSENEVIDCIMNGKIDGSVAHERILKYFTWDSAGRTFRNLLYG